MPNYCSPWKQVDRTNERILRVDLRADKTTLMETFRAYLDFVEMVKASDPGKFAAWWPDQTRKKKRHNRDVDIWRLHREGMSSAEIGRRLKIQGAQSSTPSIKSTKKLRGSHLIAAPSVGSISRRRDNTALIFSVSYQKNGGLTRIP